MELEPIPNHIKLSILNTYGYTKAVNKDSFIEGTEIAFVKSEEHYTRVIDLLKLELSESNKIVEMYIKNIQTISNIIDTTLSNKD